MKRAIIPFSFESQSVRVVDQDGEPWFVLGDVCTVLSIRNSRDAAGRLDDDEKADVGITDTSSNGTVQSRNVTIINESGLWALVLTSRKSEAKRFRKWVTGEVIPSIRKHGSYGAVNEAVSLAEGVTTVGETRRTFGKLAARQIWFKLGLPIVPAMLAPAAQHELFPA